jgi:hypothetical protein
MTPPILTYNKPNASQLGVDLDRLMISRLLIEANSGGGKSWAVRHLLEQTFGRVQHVVIDPEGEYYTLREKYPYILAAKTGGDTLADVKTAKLLCRKLMETGASAIIDLYEHAPDVRAEFVKIFLTEMTNLPKSLWRPSLQVVDEAHKFFPESGHGSSVALEAGVSWISLSRKRGFCPVLGTQRISKLNKDAAAELNNKMIGRTGLDIDVKRAGDELGFDKEQRQTLKHLEPGTFYVFGPAFSREVTLVRTGKVETTHPEPGQMSAAPPATPAKVKALLAQLGDLPQEAEEEARTVADLQKQVKQLKGDLTRAQRSSGAPDPAAVQRQVDAAVEKARATWTKDLRRIVGKDLVTLAGAIDRAKGFAGRLDRMLADVVTAFLAVDGDLSPKGEINITPPERSPAAAPRPQSVHPARRPVSPPADPDASVSGPQQAMLDALASFEAIGVEQMAKVHVAVFSNQSSRSSGFRANLSTLSAKGLIERVDSETVRLTDAGRGAASAAAPPATLEELHDAWKAKISGPQKLMLELLLAEYPEGIEKDDLARNSGQSPTSSGFRANLSTLSALGLIDRGGGVITAGALLYPEGL